MHNHERCQHKEAKYCEKCDIFYCEKCSKEWKVSYSSVTIGSIDHPMNNLLMTNKGIGDYYTKLPDIINVQN